MEDRYRAMALLNVRNIAGYNQKVSDMRATGKEIKKTIQVGFDKETGRPLYEEQVVDTTPMPYIVIVVDEMADLMLVAGKEVEAAIQRLAQMARAAGIHLIMSTQRPSVDVITGTIKANFPSRISFHVTTKIDSRTILGEQGAEQLLGMGDMLYMPSGLRPIRVHGCFVTDAEVERVVEFIKSEGEPKYVADVTEGELNTGKDTPVFDKGEMGGDNSDDDLYNQAVAIVRADKKASTSYIQRKLRLGYNRAAILIERMEDEGIVTPPDRVGRREVIGAEWTTKFIFTQQKHRPSFQKTGANFQSLDNELTHINFFIPYTNLYLNIKSYSPLDNRLLSSAAVSNKTSASSANLSAINI